MKAIHLLSTSSLEGACVLLKQSGTASCLLQAVHYPYIPVSYTQDYRASDNFMTLDLVLQPGYGPTITNSVLSNTGDDAIAVHGVYEMVAQVTAKTRTVTVAYWSCSDPSCIAINVGDTLLMYASDQRNLGTAVVRTIVAANNPMTITGNSPNSPAVSLSRNCLIPLLAALMIVSAS